MWVFIRGSDTHLLPSWGEPSKASLKQISVEGARLDDLNKLLTNMPNTPWPLQTLSDPDWLYEHGRKYSIHFFYFIIHYQLF